MLGRKLNEPAGSLISSLKNSGWSYQANWILKTCDKVCSYFGKNAALEQVSAVALARGITVIMNDCCRRFTATYNFFVLATTGLVFKVDYFHLGNYGLGSLTRHHARPPLYVIMVYRYTNCIILRLMMD